MNGIIIIHGPSIQWGASWPQEGMKPWPRYHTHERREPRERSETKGIYGMPVCVRAKSRQLCLTLCDPVDCSPPGSSVHGDSPGKNTGAAVPSPGDIYCDSTCIKYPEEEGFERQKSDWWVTGPGVGEIRSDS